MRFEWRKWLGKKRFCITSYGWVTDPNEGLMESSEVTPFEEWSADQRLDMLRHVPEIFKSAEEQLKLFIDRTRDEEVEQ